MGRLYNFDVKDMSKRALLLSLLMLSSFMFLSNSHSNTLPCESKELLPCSKNLYYYTASDAPISIDGNTALNSSDYTTGNGTYTHPFIIENVIINTTYDGGITIKNTNKPLIIRNCTIRNGTFEGVYPDIAAVYLENCTNVNITENVLKYTVKAIELIDSHNNSISNNDCSENCCGIYFNNSTENEILYNNITNNEDLGIDIYKSSNNTLSGNYFFNNSGGIQNRWSSEILIHNSKFLEHEGIGCDHCENMKIQNCTLKCLDVVGSLGISSGSSINISLINNTVLNFEKNLFYVNTCDSYIGYTYFANTLDSDYHDGELQFEDECSNFIIEYNTLYNLTCNGLEIRTGENYTIRYNTFEKGLSGIQAANTTKMYIYENNFFNADFSIANTSKIDFISNNLTNCGGMLIENSYLNISYNRYTNCGVWGLDCENISVAYNVFCNGLIELINSTNVVKLENTYPCHVPFIEINLPTYDENYGSDAPDFNVEVVDHDLENLWYSINDGINISISINGTIDEIIWENLPDGRVTITFYANDTAGHLSSASIDIFKTSNSESGNGGNNDANPLIIFIVLVVSIVAISILMVVHRKRRKVRFYRNKSDESD